MKTSKKAMILLFVVTGRGRTRLVRAQSFGEKRVRKKREAEAIFSPSDQRPNNLEVDDAEDDQCYIRKKAKDKRYLSARLAKTKSHLTFCRFSTAPYR